MTTYRLRDGDRLVFSVDGAAWETFVFAAGDFGDIKAVTASEIVDALGKVGSLAAYVDAEGNAVIASRSRGGNASLEIDLAESTAAVGLGLSGQAHEIHGSGLHQPRLQGLRTEPFRVPASAEMTVAVDGRSRRITFVGTGRTTLSAEDVAGAINKKVRGLARATRDGRVMLQSKNIGPDASLRIKGASRGRKDAAEIFGFVGAAALSQPHHAEPARITARGGQGVVLIATNLTSNMIEVHSGSGTFRLPPRTSLPVTPHHIADVALQRLVRSGSIRLTHQIEK